jgi:hypothetical protein
MNQPDAQTAPNYVTCPCQFCSGKIEFDANQFDPAENTTVPCPHCELETIIFVPEQKVPPVVSNDDFHLRNAREVEREEEIRKTGIREAQDNPAAPTNLETVHAQSVGVPPANLAAASRPAHNVPPCLIDDISPPQLVALRT